MIDSVRPGLTRSAKNQIMIQYYDSAVRVAHFSSVYEELFYFGFTAPTVFLSFELEARLVRELNSRKERGQESLYLSFFLTSVQSSPSLESILCFCEGV